MQICSIQTYHNYLLEFNNVYIMYDLEYVSVSQNGTQVSIQCKKYYVTKILLGQSSLYNKQNISNA